MSYILGVDQGTTGSTAVLLNASSGKFKASVNIPFKQYFPRPGWVEHEPKDIWKSVEKAIRGVLRKAHASADEIIGIGITNQRESVSLFDGARPLHRFIVWQDRRTADFCRNIPKSVSQKIQRLTGTPVDPYFSSTKIAYLKNHLKLSAKNKDIRFRTIDSFLIQKLCGEDVIEATNAHRTQLMNLKTVKWSNELFEYFRIPKSYAPEIIPSEGFELKTKTSSILPKGIPVVACLGDQQAALFGQAGWLAGQGKITYGTGAFVLLNTGNKPVISKNKLVSTLALQWRNGKSLYALEGSVFICGAWVQWLRDQLGMLKTSDEIEELAKKVSDSGEVMVVPALSGMGAPFWRSDLRGQILGLSRGSNANHLARASLEALAFQNKALIECMKKDAPGLRTRWKVDGGAVKNNLLMQIQADVFQSKIHRPKNLEATATGVALLAAYSKALLSLSDIQKIWKEDRVFTPKASMAKYYGSAYKKWTQTIKTSPLL